jgi:hypothetical protein
MIDAIRPALIRVAELVQVLNVTAGPLEPVAPTGKLIVSPALSVVVLSEAVPANVAFWLLSRVSAVVLFVLTWNESALGIEILKKTPGA